MTMTDLKEETAPDAWWAPAALCWSFLTVLPAPFVEATPGVLRRAVALFPVVGALIGASLGLLGLALDRALPAGPVAVVLLATDAWITGGLHFDALMDTADGVFGGRTVERRLEIMKDSRIGSFGALAGVLAILAQYACLSGLTGPTRLVALVAALTVGRWVMAVAIGAFPSARPSGLGATFQSVSGRWPVVVATVLTVAMAAVTGPVGIGAVVSGAVIVFFGGRFLAARLGGLTGDSYGALGVVAETVALYVAVVVMG